MVSTIISLAILFSLITGFIYLHWKDKKERENRLRK